MNKLFEQLDILPAFNSFKAAVKEMLSLDGKTEPRDNAYLDFGDKIRHEDGYSIEYSEYDLQHQAIEDLLDNDDLLDEFVTEQIREETIELVKALIKEIVR